VRLKVTPPYDFQRSAGVFGRLPNQVSDYYIGGEYRRVLQGAEGTCLVGVSSRGPSDDPEIRVRALVPESAIVSPGVAERISWILGSDFDLKPLYQLMDLERETSALKDSLYGLKPTRSADLFEAVVIAISEQRVSLSTAMAVRQRLAERFGVSIEHEGRRYHGLPSASALAQCTTAELISVGLSEMKATAMLAVAGLVRDDEAALHSIFSLPVGEVMSTMTRIRGIGPWTVAYVLSRGAGRYADPPLKDTALRRGIAKWYGSGAGATDGAVRRILSRFGEYSAYAAFYFIFSYAYERYGAPQSLF